MPGPWQTSFGSRLRVLWSDMLGDGTIVQVVEDDDHRRQIELVDPNGSCLGTEVEGEGVRIILKSAGDRGVIFRAIEFAFGRIGEKRPHRSDSGGP